MNARLLLLVPLLALTAPALAGDLYKCEGDKGAVTISSSPCPPGTKQVWRRDATPDTALTPEQEAQAEQRRIRDRDDARALSLMAGTSKLEPAPAPTPAPAPAAQAEPEAAPAIEGPCRKAHALADGIRANPWLEMRDDQMRRLDAWVAAQCRDPES